MRMGCGLVAAASMASDNVLYWLCCGEFSGSDATSSLVVRARGELVGTK